MACRHSPRANRPHLRNAAGNTVLVLAVLVVVVALSAYHFSTLARVSMQESASRADLLRHAIFQRAHDVVPGAADPYKALQQDGGIRALLESSVAYSGNVTYAAIVTIAGQAVFLFNFSQFVEWPAQAFGARA